MALSFSTDRHSSVIWSWEALVKDIPLAEPPLMLVKTFLTSVVTTAGPTRKLLPYSDVIDTTINILDDVWPGPLLQGEVWIPGLAIPTVRVPHRSAGSPFVPGMWVHGQLSPSDAAGFFPRGDASTIHGRSPGSLPDPGVRVHPGSQLVSSLGWEVAGGGEETPPVLPLVNIVIGEAVICSLLSRVNYWQLAMLHLVLRDLDKICSVTVLHDSMTGVHVDGVLGTRVEEPASAQQAAHVAQILKWVIHFTLV